VLKRSKLIIALVIVVGALRFADAEDQCIAPYGTEAVKNFLHQLQTAVADNDQRRVVAMVRLPITIMVAGKSTKIQSRVQLLRYYDVAFDAKVKGFIAKQEFSELFCNWQGIMIGRGEIWINAVGEPAMLRIITINNNPPWSPEDK